MNKKNSNTNNKVDKNKTSSKFQLRKPLGPRKLIIKIFSNFKRKNLHKSPHFWFANFFFLFFTFKIFQISLYLNEFAIMIPKDEAMNNLIYLNNTQLSKMNPQELHKYLDELEKLKEERKIKKQMERLNQFENENIKNI